MKYYRVPAHLDQKRLKNDRFLIENELYTETECKRYRIDPDRLQLVEIPKTRVYWFFGARFQTEEEK